MTVYTRLDANARPGPSLGVHLLAGLPTEGVRWGFERAAELMPVVPLDGLVDAVVEDETRIGVRLPPFVEPSFLIESWEECDFLLHRFGRPAHIASVLTFVDVDCAVDHLASAVPLSRHGWGRSHLDRRSVADMLVEQIEPATHLALVSAPSTSDRLARRLDVLNPGASRIPLRNGSGRDLLGLAAALGSGGGAAPGRVVPPWLAALQGELDPAPRSDLFLYRRARPFDPGRFADWLANPPRDLVRGKGRVWLASDPDRCIGYSCAGSVHRLFPSGRWWASRADGAWPSCASQQRRLLERWHPRFGDRRQELVFAGVDLDPDGVFAGLDACLVSGEAFDAALHASGAEGPGTLPTSSTKHH